MRYDPGTPLLFVRDEEWGRLGLSLKLAMIAAMA